ncbi:O-methyltransferase [Phanerochaete sordida]|uniref:O-methyltransferase n=1 Tax=Phanerochaete sordida TaxID=48140 RepID=A0A9P3G7K0_9APHY|nr:O-methyltransferase [Phanerochaete sordida]
MSSLEERIDTLRALVRTLTDASEAVIAAWQRDAAAPPAPKSLASSVPSHALFDARRTAIGAAGMLMVLVQDPRIRAMELCAQYLEARAWHIAVEKSVPDVLAEAGPGEGVAIQRLSEATGINEDKLIRVMRCLCSNHTFSEVREGYFANTHMSEALVGNQELAAWIISMSRHQYASSVKLPEVLYDPVKTHSNSDRDTAFNAYHQTNLSHWEWLEEPVVHPDGSKGPKPDLEIFSMAMRGGGKAAGPPLYVDYPWDSIKGLVVDVGGGVGGMCLDLGTLYPHLEFVIEDRAPVLEQAKELWAKELPGHVASNRVSFVPHDFFTSQPVHGAAVYNLRYILHDWDDARALAILRALRPALGADSRILVCDQLLDTTRGSPHIAPAPPPLPANYGCALRMAHARDLNMLALSNGRERTPADVARLAARAGLRVARVWPCRGLVWITELRVAE